MSSFDDWSTYLKRSTDIRISDWWKTMGADEIARAAYNAGMERAAEIAVQSNPDSRSVVITEVCREIASNIRKEVEK